MARADTVIRCQSVVWEPFGWSVLGNKKAEKLIKRHKIELFHKNSAVMLQQVLHCGIEV